jgi:IS605 OrfB family transposase
MTKKPIPVEVATCVRTLRLKVKSEAYPWLNAAAIEVNQVWNWANSTSYKAAYPFAGPGLRTTATTSDGAKLEAGRFYRDVERKIGQAQRRGHKAQAKRLHRTAARRRNDALHKFSRKLVCGYQTIIVGDVSATQLTKTRMAKSVLDAGWGALKTQLQYKGQQAGRSVCIVNEQYTTRVCSSCGSLSGPKGLDMLEVRIWRCVECGDTHDRDVNAARNILSAGRRPPSVSGNEPLPSVVPSRTSSRCEARDSG